MCLLVCTNTLGGTYYIHWKHLPIIKEVGVDGSVYWGVSSQTDSSPNKTASQKVFNPHNPPRWVAVSRDLLVKLDLSFGDTVIIHSCLGPSWVEGKWVVEDVMNKRFENKVDFLTKPGIMGRFKGLSIQKQGHGLLPW